MAHPDQYYAVIDFFKRGWSQKTHQRMSAEIFSGPNQLAYRIEGRWCESATLINVATGEREVLWHKRPYPENW